MGRVGNSKTSAKQASKKQTKVEVDSSALAAYKAPQKTSRVIGFYSDRTGRPFREFSNFFSDAPPFRFTFPSFAQREGLPLSVDCEFSEKAIMLAKAAMMGDEEMFHEIAAATNPKDCKALGRGIRKFDQELWSRHLDQLAFEVVKHKFNANKALRAVLLSTGDAILAEAAPNDGIWGIGLSLSDDRVLDPSQWCGQNVLGTALMKARSYLRGDPCTDAAVSGYTNADRSNASAPVTTVESGAEPIEHQDGDRIVAEDLEVDPQENFLRSITDLAGVRACYERYGVVGVTGVLSPDECQSLIVDGLEPYLPVGCHMDKPETFDLADRAVNRYGVIGKEALFSSSILAARLHPNVAAAYSAVHGREDVFACHDRAAWMRPAAMNHAWDTPFSWPGLHFDVSLQSYFDGNRADVDKFLAASDYKNGNFVSENNAKHCSMGRTVQGVLNLYDNDEEDGGFQCVPGMFDVILRKWVSAHPALPKPEPNGKYELKGFGVDRNLGAQAVRIPCPAGTLILFDATLPHGTKPNASARSRAILFLRYLTSDELPAVAWRDRNAALRRICGKVGFEPDSEQAKHLYGPEEL